MKIEKIELRELTGTMKSKGTFWEERLARPIDTYPDYRVEGFNETKFGKGQDYSKEQAIPVSAIFIEIKTDVGVSGIGGPIDRAQAYLIKEQLYHINFHSNELIINYG